MNKLKIISIVTVLIGGGMLSDIGRAYCNPYGCKSWDDNDGTSYGEGAICDGYWVHTYAAPNCSRDLDCALDDDDTAYAVCYNGYCMRRPGLENDPDILSYTGMTYLGMLDTNYPCPGHGRCERNEFLGCDSRYYPQPVTVHNTPISPDEGNVVAINIQCLPCPQYNDSSVVLKSLDFDAYDDVWGITSCYLLSGEDATGKYQYTGDGCQYSE